MSMNLEKMSVGGEQAKEARAEVSNELISSHEISSKIIEEINQEDIASTDRTKKELENFVTEKKDDSGREKIAQLSFQALEELESEIKSREKGQAKGKGLMKMMNEFSNMFVSKEDNEKALKIIEQAKGMVAGAEKNGGDFPDVYSVARRAGLSIGRLEEFRAQGLPEREDKKFSAPESYNARIMGGK